MLGDNYVELANESIKKQISERQKAGEAFFEAEQGGFTGISEDVNFYINKNNHPVIVFEKYEIAPGSSGEIEFEIIKTKDIEILEIGTNDETVHMTEVYEDNFQPSMAGFSISVLRLDDQMKQLLDAKADTPAIKA